VPRFSDRFIRFTDYFLARYSLGMAPVSRYRCRSGKLWLRLPGRLEDDIAAPNWKRFKHSLDARFEGYTRSPRQIDVGCLSANYDTVLLPLRQLCLQTARSWQAIIGPARFALLYAYGLGPGVVRDPSRESQRYRSESFPSKSLLGPASGATTSGHRRRLREKSTGFESNFLGHHPTTAPVVPVINVRERDQNPQRPYERVA